MLRQVALFAKRGMVSVLTIGLCLCSLVSASIAAHKDPAPIPDEIVSRIVETSTGADPVVAALGRHLDEAAQLLREAEAVDADKAFRAAGPQLAAKRMLIAAKRNELSTLRGEVRAKFMETRSRLSSLGLSGKVKDWDGFVAQVEARFDRIGTALEETHTASDKVARGKAYAKARRELHDLYGRVKEREQALGDAPLPTWTQDERPPQQPDFTDAKDRPAYLSFQPIGNNVYASLDLTHLAALPDPTPAGAQSCGYAAADLGENQEIKLTPEIKSLAEKLGYSPARIFEYVSNEIRFEPYYGSLKGAMGTLVAKSGNSTDQASLLIALLRASNYPARYVKGNTNFANEARLLRWLGAKTQVAASKILASGGIPTSFDSASGTVQFTHVWVEACVPYAHYRGAKFDNAGHRWIPLDPSFKDKSYQSGISTNVSFDYTNYLATRSNVLPFEAYEQQVEGAIKSLAPNYGNNTLEDVPYKGKALQRRIEILPASPPYEVVNFPAWGAGITTSDTAEVPDSHRVKFMVTSMNGSGSTLASATLSLPQTSLSRTTLSYKGSTSADQTALDAWKNDGNSNSSIPCTINVVPVIKNEGTVVATGTTSVGLCTTNNQLKLTVSLADLASPTLNTVTYTNIGAANYHALQAYAFQTSDRLLTERGARLLNSVRTTSNPNSNQEEIEGEFLNLVGLKYMRYTSDAAKRVAELDGGSGESGNHLGLTSSRMKVQYLFDLPFAVNREGFLIDVPGGLSRNRDLSTGEGVWKTFKLAGYSSSALEAYIWQENSRLDAVSTVRGLQFAKETGIEVLTLTSSNWSVSGDTGCTNSSSQCYKFTHNSSSSLNYAPSQISSIKTNFIDQGYTVIIPRSLIQYQTWKGAVFVGEKNDTANKKMSGTYAINQYAGGHTVSQQVTFQYSKGTDSGYVQANTGNSTTGAAVDINSVINWGDGPYGISAGDPVNMVNGNMYHTERDLSIKGRGGLPLVFERFYNSIIPQDGPLGFGWTHSFNHYLTFKDNNYNGATDSGDTDGVTSAVSWTDGSGAQKTMRVTGNSGGVSIGSAFTPSQGFFHQVIRNSDGTYGIREKNGLTYTFENVAGKVNQKAKLLSIKDRNGNSLTMGYTSGNLTSVTDGLGRILTLSYTGSRITQIQDWTGRKHQYVYDANGNLITYKNPLAIAGSQNPVTYEYYGATDGTNINHAMKKYILPRGNSMTFEYYSNGRVFKHYNTLGETNTFSYNDFRRETVQVSERGFTRRFFFDKYGNPQQIKEENGAEREYTYDAANPYNRISKKDPEGYLTGYQYDASGNVTQITNPSGATVQFSYFNTFNQPGKVKDAKGNYTLYKYDAKGNLLQEIKLKTGLGSAINPTTYTPAAGDIVAWTINTYDTYGNPLSSKHVRDFSSQTGPSVEYTYDSQTLNATTITRRGDKNGDGAIAAGEYDSASLAYDSLGRVKTGIDADWHPTQFVYDDVDRVTRGTDALGKLRDYRYDVNGNPIGQKLEMSVNSLPTLIDSSSASFDLSDRREKNIDSDGNATAYQYDAAGNVVRITNPDSYTLSFEYDENNRVIKAYDQENNAVTKTLDLSGKPRSITDPNGNTVTYEYYDGTKDGRLKKVIQPKIQSFSAGRGIQYDYDVNGNVTAVTDIPADGSASRTTVTTYDEQNRPVRIVGPVYTDAALGSIRPVTRYSYDNLGNLVGVSSGRTDSSGSNPASDVVATQLTYKFDDFGRKIRETDALGKFWTFEYDVNNNLTKSTDAKTQVTQYTWGYGHQLLTRVSSAGTTTYVRNALGQAISAASPSVTYTYSYDPSHRLESVSDSRGKKTLSYDYSPGGLLNSVTDSDENETDYLYDNVGRLSGIWAANNDTVTFSYDKGGRLTEKWFPNGVSARYSYNADNSISQVVNRSGSSAIISQHDYSYDGVGNRLSHTEKVGSITTSYGYLYDELNRLTQVGNGTAAQQENYVYDPLGNRTVKKVNATTPVVTAYVYDAANQLKEIRQNSASGALLASFGYDGNGNMTSKSEGGVTTALSYDALNRLSSVSKTGIASQSYLYDDQGRRIRKTVGATSTNYLYDGPDVVAEYTNWATPVAMYTHGPNTDDPLIRATATAAQYFHQDGLGSVVALSDQSGAQVGTQRFDAWGNKLSSTGTIPRYGYTGREPDETGLVYYRARYYDPSIGRFTQRDPIGLQGGVNLYAYVNGNPVNFVDPMGLTARDPQETGIMLAANTYVNTASDASSGMIFTGAQNLPSSVQADKNSNIGIQPALFGNLDDLIPLAAGAKLGTGLLLGTMKVIGTESAEVAAKSALMHDVLATIEQIDPRNLIPTQTKNEMSGSLIKRLTNNMKIEGYDLTKPVTAIRNALGRLEIEDGHHRAAAAIRAGIKKIPVKILE